MKVINILLLALSIIISSDAQTIFRNEIAPKIEFTSWINNSEGLSVIEGKPIVLEFWASWCAPCIASIPHLNHLKEKYGHNVVFIFVNSFESRAKVESFLSKTQISSNVALDEDQKLKEAFNAQNIPVTIIIDKDGKLRWRGIASKLTEDILDTFLLENKFNDTEKRGIILDENITIDNPRNIEYHLRIEHGDATLGKGIAVDFENRVYLKLSNYNIYSFFVTISNLLEYVDDWRFEGNLPELEIINIEIKSDTEITEKRTTNSDIILNNVILKLGDYYNFDIIQSEEIQEIWYIKPNYAQLEKHLSIEQNLDIQEVEKTEESVKFKNVFFEFLASLISNSTKTKVQYIPSGSFMKYDLIIPNTDDILEMQEFLGEGYGIDLILEKTKVNVKTVRFK